jgi:hypothetical protein
MKKILWILLAASIFQFGISDLHAQAAINPIKVVPSDPSGACPPARIDLSTASGNAFYCDPATMMWTQFGSGGGGGGVSSITATAPIVVTPSPITNTGIISCVVATGSVAGCLSAADWTTFNGKQAAGSYITALTGDVTASGPGSAVATLANIPTATPMSGSLLATTIAAPGTPAAGKGSIYVDSTSKNLAVKDDAGVVKHGVQTDTGAANNYISAISDEGLITKSRPACATLSDSGTGCSAAAGITQLTGDVTAGAGSGSQAATVVKVNGIAYSATAAAHTVQVTTTANTAVTAKVVPDCTDTGGNHLNFTQSSDAFSCGTSGGGSGSFVLVEQHTASTSSSLDFTTCLSSTYDTYQIVIEGLLPATNAVYTSLRFSTNGGSSYDSGSNYTYGSWRWVNAGAAQKVSTGQTEIVLDGGGGVDFLTNTSNQGLTGTFLLTNTNVAAYKLVTGTTAFFNSGSAFEGAVVNHQYLITTTINAFRIAPSSGNWASGTVRCYGIAK